MITYLDRLEEWLNSPAHRDACVAWDNGHRCCLQRHELVSLVQCLTADAPPRNLNALLRHAWDTGHGRAIVEQMIRTVWDVEHVLHLIAERLVYLSNEKVHPDESLSGAAGANRNYTHRMERIAQSVATAGEGITRQWLQDLK